MRKRLILPIILMLAICAGCAKSSPPLVPAPDSCRSTRGRVIWGAWSLDFDPSIPVARAVPIRLASFHVDVTPFITPPECSDCIELTVLEFSTDDGILDLEASVTNPTEFSGFDVRAILRWETGHVWLENPDDYTLLFDDGGDRTLNPFIAYAVEEADREFGAAETYTREIDFRFSETGHFGEITFVVEASYPVHCNEPYEISNQSVSGELVGPLPVIVSCQVSDWQDDVTAVTVDAGPLADDPFELTQDSDTRWSGTISNLNGVDPGVYDLLIRAASPGSLQADSIYDYVQVTVAEPPETGLDPGPWPMLGQNAQHTSRGDFDGPATEPDLEWDSSTGGANWERTYAGPSIGSNGNIYVAANTGVFCFDSDGNPEWDEPAPFANAWSPPQPLLTASGLVIVCWSSLLSNSEPQGIYAYRMSDGDEVWSLTSIDYTGGPGPKGFSVYDSPVITEDGLIVAVAREHVIVAVDELTGCQMWLWPDDSSEYHSILAGSYLDSWRGAPAIGPDGDIVAVADWFENPRLIVLDEYGHSSVDEPLTTLSTVNCHPMVTDYNEVILAGFVLDVVYSSAAVEARNLYGQFLWDYTDDVIRVLQGMPGIGPDGSLYFLDGTGVADTEYPYEYSVYLLVLSRFGQFSGRHKIFTRATGGSVAVTHFRNGVSVGDKGKVYVSTCARHSVLETTLVSGVAAIDPIFGTVLWSYGEQQNASAAASYYGTPAIGADGRVYATRYDRVQALE